MTSSQKNTLPWLDFYRYYFYVNLLNCFYFQQKSELEWSGQECAGAFVVRQQIVGYNIAASDFEQCATKVKAGALCPRHSPLRCPALRCVLNTPRFWFMYPFTLNANGTQRASNQLSTTRPPLFISSPLSHSL